MRPSPTIYIYNDMLQHSVALASNLICRGCLEGKVVLVETVGFHSFTNFTSIIFLDVMWSSPSTLRTFRTMN
jgi:hypothetical protein